MAEVKRTLAEGMLVTVVGLLVGLAANVVYSDGLSLTRNYFPSASPVGSDGKADGKAPDETVENRLIAKGLTPISFADVVATFEDPLYEAGAYLFVDARDDKHYAEGHIPGAFQLDHYRILNYIDEVLPFCQVAEKIVVYCTGGECEDSEFATLALRDEFGVAAEKLHVFIGGIEEWNRNKMPVEVGPRMSGDIRSAGDE